MKGMGTDEAPIVEILARRSQSQRAEIAQTYKREFGRVSWMVGVLGGGADPMVVICVELCARWAARGVTLSSFPVYA